VFGEIKIEMNNKNDIMEKHKKVLTLMYAAIVCFAFFMYKPTCTDSGDYTTFTGALNYIVEYFKSISIESVATVLMVVAIYFCKRKVLVFTEYELPVKIVGVIASAVSIAGSNYLYNDGFGFVRKGGETVRKFPDSAK